MLILFSASASHTRAKVPGRFSRKIASCLGMCIVSTPVEGWGTTHPPDDKSYHALAESQKVKRRNQPMGEDFGSHDFFYPNASAGQASGNCRRCSDVAIHFPPQRKRIGHRPWTRR